MLKKFLGAFLIILSLSSCSSVPDVYVEDIKTTQETQPHTLSVEEQLPAEPVLENVDFGDYLAGFFALKEKDIPTAAHYYQRAYNQDKQNFDLLTTTFVLTGVTGDIDKAGPLAEKALAITPSDPITRYVAGTYYLKKGDLKKAKDIISPIQRVGFSNILVSIMEAWIYAGEGNQEEALSSLNALLEDEEVSALYHFHRALILEYFGRMKESAQEYQVLLDAQATSLKILLSMLNFYKKLGLENKKVDFLEAYQKAYYSSILENNFLSSPNPAEVIDSPQKGAADALFTMAATYALRQNIETSLLLARLALYLHPDSLLMQFLAAELLESCGQFAEANVFYEELVKNKKMQEFAYLKWGNNLRAMKKYKEALAAFEKVRKINPELLSSYRYIGDTYIDLEDYRSAIKYYDEAISRASSEDPDLWQVYFSRGTASYQLRDIKRTYEDMRKSLELSPDNPIVLNFLGYTMLENGDDMEEAFEMIQKAAELFPENGSVLDSLGWACFLKGAYPQSVEILEKAAALEASNALINSHLGDAYWKVGRKREAVFQWEKSLSLKEEQSEELRSYLQEKIKKGWFSQEKNKMTTEKTPPFPIRKPENK